MSPEYCSPPSPISGTPAGRQARAALWMAVTWGTPTPATTRVVQIDPGPTPTLTPSAPASTRALAPAYVATLPPMMSTSAAAGSAFSRRHHLQHALGVTVGGVDDQQVDPLLDQRHRPLPGVAEEADGGADAQPALVVLGGVGVLVGLDEVLERDQAAAAGPARRPAAASRSCSGPAAPSRRSADADPAGDQRHLGHHLTDQPGRVGLEPHVAVGDDAEQLQVLVDDRDPGDLETAAHRLGLADGRLRRDGDRLVDHPGLGALDHVDLVRLVLDGQVAVDDPQPALPGDGHRHPGLGDGVHRGGDQGYADGDPLGHPGRRGHLRGDDVALGRLQQHVVEGQPDPFEGQRHASRTEIIGRQHGPAFRAQR